jgi:outer membrane usher protein
MTPRGLARVRRCACGLLIFAAIGGAVLGAQATRVPVTVVLNGQDEGQAVALLEGADVWLPLPWLRQAGLQVERGERRDSQSEVFVRLASLAPALSFTFDPDTIALTLDAAPELFAAQTLDLRNPAAGRVPIARGPSAFLNYSATAEEGSTGLFVAELGTNIRGALFTATALRDSASGWTRGLVRMIVDDRGRLRRWSAGDDVVVTGSLGRAVPLFGVSVSKAFEIDPYFVPLPSLSFTGAAATPATVEVYVNNQLVRREAVQPGAFTLEGLTPVVGDGLARVVIRDAFGREQVLERTFYQPVSVLARGVQAYWYAAGRRRDTVADWGSGPWLTTAAHRVGVTDSLTVGGRLEATSDIVSTGPQVAFRTPVGEMEVSVAGSFDRGTRQPGGAGLVAYSYQRAAMSAGAFVRVASRNYVDAAPPGPIVPERLEASVFAGVPLGPRLSATMRYDARRDWRDADLRRASITGFVRLTGWLGLSMTYADVAERGVHRAQAFAALTLVATPRTTAALTADSGTGRPIDVGASVQRALPVGTGYGYRVQLQEGDARYMTAEVQAQGRFGRVEAANRTLDGRSQASVTAAGGLALVGGSLHATRPITDAFALVRVPDHENVRAYVSGQLVGRTNRRGELLVPDLLSYHENQVRIAAEDVTMDAVIERDEDVVAPPLRGGAVVTFAAPRVQRLIGRVRLGAGPGAATPSTFGELRLEDGRTSPIGRDGLFYFENVAPGTYRATLLQDDGTWACVLVVPKTDAAQIPAGIVTCTAPEGGR